MNGQTKICITCKKDLLLNNDNFAKMKRSNDGFTSVCKPCKREYDKLYRSRNSNKIKEKKKKYYDENKEKCSAYSKKWYAENKEHVKRYREENKDRITEYNKREWAEKKEERKVKVNEWRKENAQYIKEYRKANRDRDREKAREWGRSERGNRLRRTTTNRYRARKKSLKNDFTEKQWEECMKHFDYTCAYCGSNEKLEQDHFIPITKNGHFTKDNIIPSCRSCNGSKSNSNFKDWYKNQNYYSREREFKILTYLGKKVLDDSLPLYGQGVK
ncbi:HNH endonuclease [Bacillus thuringiensis]|uniref:HNH endonuclease n=1 Tax=Bacillus thuringiensis TaxID=1428 RepID=UPI0015D4A861|nr:HNH endonuclease [Bacillus thuringiensis]